MTERLVMAAMTATLLAQRSDPAVAPVEGLGAVDATSHPYVAIEVIPRPIDTDASSPRYLRPVSRLISTRYRVVGSYPTEDAMKAAWASHA